MMTKHVKKPVPLKMVSACMAGVQCRYNGQSKTVPMLRDMVQRGDAIALCPERLAGLATPRRPAEIKGGDGYAVLDGKARVYDDLGEDLTGAFIIAAYKTLHVLQAAGVNEVVLKEGSPSCGCNEIYDGTFSGTRKSGVGVTTALLLRSGIHVYSEKMLFGDAQPELVLSNM
ncbi:DUF523 domain-containing protein [Dictyobacter formicarum]|uniref:Purine-nucleoside phosphorylase n=1 Tax=Dictyobacter formicarum TaxID=2778368 RepID=A0ABQ3VDY6_9CHLR|nr:DUF523 domain-containing protein [Dictyobacter formicarum]GHO83598.1 hypothetical protein KSZ_16040 [Dictyobacter formicarum]